MLSLKKSILLFFVLFSILLYSFFLWFSGDVKYDKIIKLQKQLTYIRLLDIKEDMLVEQINLTNNLDELSNLSAHIMEEVSSFAADMKEFDDSSTLILSDKLKKQESAIEHYKSYHSGIKNSIKYVYNFTIESYQNKYLSEDMRSLIQNILLGYYTKNLSLVEKKFSYQMNNIQHYKDEIEANRDKMFSGMESEKTEYDLLIIHINNIVSYYHKLQKEQNIIKELNTKKSFEIVDEYLQNILNIQESQNKRLIIFMSISAFIFLFVGLLMYYARSVSFIKVENLTHDLQQFVDVLNESAIVSKSDLKGKITYVNKKFIKISQYSKEELIGKPHSLIRDPDEPSTVYEELWKTIQDKRVFKAIIKNRAKDGSAYYVESVVMPLLDINGNIKEYISVRYDVTDIIEARNRAIEAQKSKDEFLSNMSHELRTPLNAILGFSQILYKKLEPQNQRYMSMVLDNSKHLLALINDILDLSKIQSGKFEINEYEFDLYKEYFLLLERIDIQAHSKSVKLNYEKINGELYLLGDWLRISQIIINLVSNAIKFSHKDGVIDLGIVYAQGELKFSVQDYGIGMSKEVQDKVFKPFVQADSSTTRKYGGTGLGLSIVTQLIELMNGRLELESKEGEGSIFKVYIPLKKVVING